MDHGLRTVGISILGGNSRVSGRYELGIDSISMVNEEDVKKTLGMSYLLLCYLLHNTHTT